jgi:hypothetical protein
MPAYKSGSEIRKLIEETRKAQSADVLNTYTVSLALTFEELRALSDFVDQCITDRRKRKHKTEAERIMLNAAEVLAAALPEPLP